MQLPEFRVRPVIRHVVTRYTPADPLPPGVNSAEGSRGSLQTLGEFDSEGYAEIVREALAEKAALREYAIIEETMGEPMARVVYAYGEQEALARMSEEAQAGKTYRVFSRVRQPLPL